jgi:hypothetical protein
MVTLKKINNSRERRPKMKKHTVLMMGLMVLVASQAWAGQAVTIEGTVQGYNCITTGKICPVGKEDPWVETEDVFALYTKDSDVYLVSNMSRESLKRHTNEIVRITGEVHPQYKSMNASKVEVMQGGEWVKAWPYFMSDFKVGPRGLPNFH